MLESPFEYKSQNFASLELSDRIRVKERRLMEKLGTLSEVDSLVGLCASLCDVDEEIFDQIGDDDFEKIAQHVVTLLEKRAEKKSADSSPQRRVGNRKSRAAHAQGVRIHSEPDP